MSRKKKVLLYPDADVKGYSVPCKLKTVCNHDPNRKCTGSCKERPYGCPYNDEYMNLCWNNID